MKTLWSLSCLVFLSASTLAVQIINDTETYKPCFAGGCEGEEVCFQYFCYPKKGAETPLRSCKKRRECQGLDVPSKCYKPTPLAGVCIPSEDFELCEGHEECEGRGGKCCGDYCCNPEYFEALQKQDCADEDEVCKEVQTDLFSIEMESLACETKDGCEEKHDGHDCCSDHPLLMGVTLSDETQNWEGDKRCCMSGKGVRQLDEIPNLTEEDIAAIDKKISELSDKREFCKDLITPLQDGFQTCVTEKEAEAEEGRTAIAEAALAEAKKHAEVAADAKSKAVAAAENAKNASDSKEAQGYVNDAFEEVANAEMAANASNIAAGDAEEAGSAGNAAVEAAEAASMAQADADAAETAATDAQDAANALKAKEDEAAAKAKADAKAEEDRKNALNVDVTDKENIATSVKVSALSVFSAVILYHLVN